MLMACGEDGLHGVPPTPACPLRAPTLIAQEAGRLALLDGTARLAWVQGRLIPVDSGVEAMLLWRGHLLTLSGDTDCLTLLSPASGAPLITTPAGVYPQDMCLLPGGRNLAVCGGSDGAVHIVTLPELRLERSIRLQGSTARITCAGGALYALCTVEDDRLCCQLHRIAHGDTELLARWPGLPGAIHTDDLGRLWIAASEALGCFIRGEYRPANGEFGLIRHMDSRGGALLLTDPVLGRCSIMTPDGRLICLHEGEVCHAVFRR